MGLRSLLRLNSLFWNHERSLTALLVYLSLSLFLWMPLSSMQWWGFVISDLLFNLILLSGVFAVLGRWRKQWFFISIAVLASSSRIVSYVLDSRWIEVVSFIVSIIFLGILARMVLTHIFKDGPVNFYRIEGSIVVFMIIGIVWALLYNLLDLVSPGAFSMRNPMATEVPFSQYLYFSFVTMSTLGYGDMVPVNPIAKSLVIFQGMIGLLYPVIMIARLVSMEVEHSGRLLREREKRMND